MIEPFAASLILDIQENRKKLKHFAIFLIAISNNYYS